MLLKRDPEDLVVLRKGLTVALPYRFFFVFLGFSKVLSFFSLRVAILGCFLRFSKDILVWLVLSVLRTICSTWFSSKPYL